MGWLRCRPRHVGFEEDHNRACLSEAPFVLLAPIRSRGLPTPRPSPYMDSTFHTVLGSIALLTTAGGGGGVADCEMDGQERRARGDGGAAALGGTRGDLAGTCQT